MPTQSKVTSVQALEAFRSSLLIFLSKGRPALEEASQDVVRSRLWLQTDQRGYWEKQVRKRSLELEEARQELFSARLSSLQEATAAQYLALRRAQRALGEAEGKLGLLKKWDRQLENDAAPLVKQLDNLQSFLSSEMPKAAAYLAEAVKTLEAYAGIAPPASSPPSAAQEHIQEPAHSVAPSSVLTVAATSDAEEARPLPGARQREDERG
jgi:hypothetical protein